MEHQREDLGLFLLPLPLGVSLSYKLHGEAPQLFLICVNNRNVALESIN